MNVLKLTGRKTDILLRTMGSEKIVSTAIVSDLEVVGLHEDHFCELHTLFTQRSMPVNQANIPLQKDLEKWPHLTHVKLTDINSGVDLLIGANVPRVLERWEVVRCVNGGPYAIKTLLGWKVNGPIR